MNSLARKASLALAVLFTTTSLLAGCGAKSAATKEAPKTAGSTTKVEQPKAKEELKEVKLTMYLLGDAPADQGLVYDEVNKKLKKDINTTVQIQNIPWADYEKKYQLLFASGEEFDCIYTGAWVGYQALATKNAFMEITEEMIKKNAPKTYELTPKDYWTQTKVKGKIYMLPNYMPKVKPQVATIRGDLREKYGIPEVKTSADYQNYLMTLAKNEKGIIPLNLNEDVTVIRAVFFSQPNNMSIYYHGTGVKFTEPALKMSVLYDMPEYTEYLKKMKQMFDAGAWSKSVLSNKTKVADSYMAGKSASFLGDAEEGMSVANKLAKDHPEWKTEICDVTGDAKKLPESGIMSGLSIHAKSKNPERVMMMYDLFRTDKEYFDLTFYGIKGKHWEPVGDLQFKQLEGSKNYGPEQDCPWGWSYLKFYRVPDNMPKNVMDMKKKWQDKDLLTTPLQVFNFDDSKQKNEIAAVENVFKTYGQALEYGLIDINTALPILKEKMKAAGIEKIQAEFQTQLDAFVKEYNSNK